MTELTLHTGCQGDWDTIHVSWHDEDNVRQLTKLDIIIQEQDKPRTLEIRIDDEKVAELVRAAYRDPRHVPPAANVQQGPI